MLAAGWAAAPGTEDATPVEPGGEATPAPSATPEATTDPAAGGETFTGVEVTNLRGAFQVRITVADGAVTAVTITQAGTEEPNSIDINSTAVPALEEAILEAQTWDVDYVSGASYTSAGVTESARDAFSQAGLD